MVRGFRHAFAVIALVVALMSGILSLIREFLLFQYPNKFQEPPLFWASVRIAFAVSLVVLWYGERQKRLELEKQLQKPKLSFKEETLNLSASILEFIYGRKGEAPKDSATPRFLNTDGTEDWMREMLESSRIAQERVNFEKDTLGIYNYRFKRDVERAISSLKGKGLDCSRIEHCVINLSNESDPHYHGITIPATMEIEEAGKQLGILADQIKES
jgi:hypothetical protein